MKKVSNITDQEFFPIGTVDEEGNVYLGIWDSLGDLIHLVGSNKPTRLCPAAYSFFKETGCSYLIIITDKSEFKVANVKSLQEIIEGLQSTL